MYNIKYVEWLIKELGFLIKRLIFCHEHSRIVDDYAINTEEYNALLDSYMQEILPVMCKIKCDRKTVQSFMTDITFFCNISGDVYRQLESAYMLELRHLKDISSSVEYSYWNQQQVGVQVYNELLEHGIDLEWLIADPKRPWEESKS